MRRTVSPPLSTEKEMSAHFGTASWEYGKLRRELNSDEIKQMEAMQRASETVVQPLEMPSATELIDKRVKMLLTDIFEDSDGVLTWFVERVNSTRDDKDGVVAEIEWDGEWENADDKVTPDMLLTSDGWNSKHVVNDSWKLA